MALATLPGAVSRVITDKRVWTDVIKAYPAVKHWWTLAQGQAYADLTTGFPRIRPRIGALDLVANGATPFGASGFRPFAPTDPAATPFFAQTIPSGGVTDVSMIVSGRCSANGATVLGLDVSSAASDTIELRPSHNAAAAIFKAGSSVNRFAAVAVALEEYFTLSVYLNFATDAVAIAKNGGAYATGTYTGIGDVNQTGWALTVGAGSGAQRYSGEIHDVMVLPGIDIRNQPALMTDYMTYRTTVWGLAG
ncbi:hypothetical protein [Paracoccus yeei]|uniref:Uncharacterized protein n=1 Tax=Paracoccus yeei TaxID=147645 RepID=A0A2D2C1E3_9RHOB|nr:hypothetical protein [Paracoccus yeei]ATQ56219.1 hypothetical protein PYTT13_10630 [Paracoccus yeei]